MTFASATTAGGSEIAQNLLLGHPSSLALRRDLLGEAQKYLAGHVGRELRCVPGQEEPRGSALTGHKESVLRAKHLTRPIAEVSDRHHSQVITMVVTTVAPGSRGSRSVYEIGLGASN